MAIVEIPEEPHIEICLVIEESNDIVPEEFLKLLFPLPILQLPVDVVLQVILPLSKPTSC